MNKILQKLKKLNLNGLLIIFGIIAIIFVGYFLIWWNRTIEIGPQAGSNQSKVSSIAGLACAAYNQRPVSVMLASDIETRPLSGIGQADMVFEMPVTPNRITRFMAVFQCEEPKDIGSVRSARKDFVPLAAGLKSIYAHWGGEHGILAELDKHIIDNLDALSDKGNAFYRKAGVPMPHNGFTTFDKIITASRFFNYNLTDTFAGYPHEKEKPNLNLSTLVDTISVDYPAPDNVQWKYDSASNTYKRTRGGTVEIDKNTGQQVSTSVIVIMKTTSALLYDQYLNVNTTGGGDAIIYQDEMSITGAWKKDPASLDSKLYFYDSRGKEIKFASGKIWVEINTD